MTRDQALHTLLSHRICVLVSVRKAGNVLHIREQPRSRNLRKYRLQADEPDTFVLATNRTETVRDFVRMAFKGAGITVDFKGSEEKETAVDTASGKTVMRINPKFYRPAEVELLIGDPAKAKAKLGWEPKTTLEQLCQMMVESDLRRNQAGFSF